MLLIFVLFSLLILFFVYSRYRDFVHPTFITIFVWLVIILSYEIYINLTDIWVPLSDSFYLYLIVFILFFTFFSNLSYFRLKSNFLTTNAISVKHEVLLNFSIFIMAFTNVYLIFLIKQVGYMEIRDNLTELPIFAKLGTYATPLAFSILCYESFINKTKKQKRKYYFAFFLLIINIFVSASKGGFFQIFICLLFILKENKKLNFKVLLSLCIGLIVLVLSLQILRSGDESKTDNFLSRFLYIYILSPLPALDLVFTNQLNLKTDFFGGTSLPFFYRFFSKLGLTKMPEIDTAARWCGVPYATNVYTLIGNYYIDFGIIGIIFCGFFYGIIFGSLYQKLKYKNDMFCKCFYSIWLYCLVFQFFGDWFVNFFSVTIQSYFWTFICTHKFKFYSLRYKNG